MSILIPLMAGILLTKVLLPQGMLSRRKFTIFEDQLFQTAITTILPRPVRRSQNHGRCILRHCSRVKQEYTVKVKLALALVPFCHDDHSVSPRMAGSMHLMKMVVGRKSF